MHISVFSSYLIVILLNRLYFFVVQDTSSCPITANVCSVKPLREAARVGPVNVIKHTALPSTIQKYTQATMGDGDDLFVQ